MPFPRLHISISFMIIGITTSFTAAFMQSSSYVCSKNYVKRNGSSFVLCAYSQIVMGVMAFAILTGLLLTNMYEISFEMKFWVHLLGVVLSTATGQLFFFMASEHVESSRIASFTSLKIVILALICLLIRHDTFTALQWLAIVMCTLAAVGMNYSGMKVPLIGLFYIALMLVSYCICDISIKLVMAESLGVNDTAKALGSASLSYLILGLLSLPLLAFMPRKLSLAKEAVPYSIFWFGAMMLVFFSFSILSVVFLNIISSTRGVISVVMGYVISKRGSNTEPPVSKQVWLKRLAMSILMITAVGLYTYSHS